MAGECSSVFVAWMLNKMFQQCISNIYDAFTNNSQNKLYTDFKAKYNEVYSLIFIQKKKSLDFIYLANNEL